MLGRCRLLVVVVVADVVVVALFVYIEGVVRAIKVVFLEHHVQVFALFLQADDILLGVAATLRRSPRDHCPSHLFPVATVLLQRLQETVVLLLTPSALVRGALPLLGCGGASSTPVVRLENDPLLIIGVRT